MKVVASQSIGTAWDIQPLPAYQYFENVRNFLVSVEDLKLPSFEASDLERVRVNNLWTQNYFLCSVFLFFE